jgi:hypothetical protein
MKGFGRTSGHIRLTEDEFGSGGSDIPDCENLLLPSHITARTSHTHFTVRFTFYCEIDAVGDYQCPSEMSVEDVPAVVKHQDTEKALDCTQVGWLIAHKLAG